MPAKGKGTPAMSLALWIAIAVVVVVVLAALGFVLLRKKRSQGGATPAGALEAAPKMRIHAFGA